MISGKLNSGARFTYTSLFKGWPYRYAFVTSFFQMLNAKGAGKEQNELKFLYLIVFDVCMRWYFFIFEYLYYKTCFVEFLFSTCVFDCHEDRTSNIFASRGIFDMGTNKNAFLSRNVVISNDTSSLYCWLWYLRSELSNISVT